MTRPDPGHVVQGTGWLMAAVRAQEYECADAYLTDGFAWPLVTDEVTAQLAEVVAAGYSLECVVVRSRLGDEIIGAAAARGVRQAVGLGAGSDTRPYRLELPAGFGFFELDLPGQIEAKHGRLAEAGFLPVHRTVSVEGDLRRDFGADLLAAGFAPDQPCVWFAEGLLMYFRPAETRALLDHVSALSAPGSEFFCDAMHERYGEREIHRRAADQAREMGIEFGATFADESIRWLAGHGWTAVAYEDADLLAGACPLLPPLPARLSVDPHQVRYVHATNAG